jgi:hypothetical protein
MIKRLLLIAAMTAALAACGTSGTTGAPGNSLAPVDSAPASMAPASVEPSGSTTPYPDGCPTWTPVPVRGHRRPCVRDARYSRRCYVARTSV